MMQGRIGSYGSVWLSEIGWSCPVLCLVRECGDGTIQERIFAPELGRLNPAKLSGPSHPTSTGSLPADGDWIGWCSSGETRRGRRGSRLGLERRQSSGSRRTRREGRTPAASELRMRVALDAMVERAELGVREVGGTGREAGSTGSPSRQAAWEESSWLRVGGARAPAVVEREGGDGWVTDMQVPGNGVRD